MALTHLLPCNSIKLLIKLLPLKIVELRKEKFYRMRMTQGLETWLAINNKGSDVFKLSYVDICDILDGKPKQEILTEKETFDLFEQMKKGGMS